jgi:hypothetical protein
MRLNPIDEYGINIFEEKFGLTQTAQLMKFLVTTAADQVLYEVEQL